MLYGLLSLLLLGCDPEKNAEGNEEGEIEEQDWWDDLEEEDGGDNTSDDSISEDKEDYEDKEDKEDYEDISYEECSEDFDNSESCEGSWQETICLFDDLIWWCQDGVWINENDKE